MQYKHKSKYKYKYKGTNLAFRETYNSMSLLKGSAVKPRLISPNGLDYDI